MKFCSCQFIFLTISVLVFLSNDVDGFVNELPDSAAKLLKTAVDLGAPFTETTADRFHTTVFGSERGPRSTDIILFNKSNMSFILSSSYCKYGGYSPSLFPEQEIKSKSSSMYRVAANGFMTGVRCTTKYESPDDGSYFEVTSRNPYIGSNSMNESFSGSLLLTPTLGIGENNEARWVIEDAI